MQAKFVSLGAITLVAAVAACTSTITDPGGLGADDGPGQQPSGSAGAGSSTGNPPGSPTTTPTPTTTSTTQPPPTVGTGEGGRLKLDTPANYYRLIRLTNEQWTKSVQGVLGLPSAPTDAERFQTPVSGTTDFTNNEQLLEVDSRVWSDYQTAAEALAAKVSSDPALLGKLYAGTDGAGFIKTVGRRIYRRPLTAMEEATYQKLFDSGPSFSGTQSAFAKGAGLVLETMLQSPHFVYRTQLGQAGAPLTGYEIAAKVSLWLRDAAPDDKILDAAGSGKYDTADGVAALAQQLIEEPSSKAVMRKFHGEFLRFGKFAELAKSGVAGYDASINTDLQESAYLFFDRIFTSGQGVKDIFLSTKGFVSSKMASLYGNTSGPVSGFEERELGANRIGYFTQLPFLMLNAHNSSPDPIHRGVTVALDVLCAPLGIFAGVLPPLPTKMPGETNRALVDRHTSGCGTTCHNDMINPLGFAFENFDGMGAYRTTEKNGSEDLAIDASGSFNFMDGVKSYENATELMQLLATSQQTHMCYSKRLAGFGLQRNISEADVPLLTKLATVSANAGSVKQVVVELVKQDAFRTNAGGAQ